MGLFNFNLLFFISSYRDEKTGLEGGHIRNLCDIGTNDPPCKRVLAYANLISLFSEFVIGLSLGVLLAKIQIEV